MGMAVEVDVAPVLARPDAMGVVGAPNALARAVVTRDDDPGHIEDAVPGQAGRDAVVVAADEEAPPTIDAGEDRVDPVLRAAVAEVAQVPTRASRLRPRRARAACGTAPRPRSRKAANHKSVNI